MRVCRWLWKWLCQCRNKGHAKGTKRRQDIQGRGQRQSSTRISTRLQRQAATATAGAGAFAADNLILLASSPPISAADEDVDEDDDDAAASVSSYDAAAAAKQQADADYLFGCLRGHFSKLHPLRGKYMPEVYAEGKYMLRRGKQRRQSNLHILSELPYDGEFFKHATTTNTPPSAEQSNYGATDRSSTSTRHLISFQALLKLVKEAHPQAKVCQRGYQGCDNKQPVIVVFGSFPPNGQFLYRDGTLHTNGNKSPPTNPAMYAFFYTLAMIMHIQYGIPYMHALLTLMNSVIVIDTCLVELPYDIISTGRKHLGKTWDKWVEFTSEATVAYIDELLTKTHPNIQFAISLGSPTWDFVTKKLRVILEKNGITIPQPGSIMHPTMSAPGSGFQPFAQKAFESTHAMNNIIAGTMGVEPIQVTSDLVHTLYRPQDESLGCFGDADASPNYIYTASYNNVIIAIEQGFTQMTETLRHTLKLKFGSIPSQVDIKDGRNEIGNMGIIISIEHCSVFRYERLSPYGYGPIPAAFSEQDRNECQFQILFY